MSDDPDAEVRVFVDHAYFKFDVDSRADVILQNLGCADGSALVERGTGLRVFSGIVPAGHYDLSEPASTEEPVVEQPTPPRKSQKKGRVPLREPAPSSSYDAETTELSFIENNRVPLRIIRIWCESLTRTPKLTYLTVHGGIGDDVAKVELLFRHLRYVPQLTHLDVGHNNIRVDINYALKQLPALTYLQLSGNMLARVAHPFDFMQHLSSLQTLYVGSNHFRTGLNMLFAWPEHLKSLSMLELSFNSWDEGSIAALAANLEHLPALRMLGASCACITADGARLLAGALQHYAPKLTHLKIPGNEKIPTNDVMWISMKTMRENANMSSVWVNFENFSAPNY